jgi:hypothetical protein
MRFQRGTGRAQQVGKCGHRGWCGVMMKHDSVVKELAVDLGQLGCADP